MERRADETWSERTVLRHRDPGRNKRNLPVCRQKRNRRTRYDKLVWYQSSAQHRRRDRYIPDFKRRCNSQTGSFCKYSLQRSGRHDKSTALCNDWTWRGRNLIYGRSVQCILWWGWCTGSNRISRKTSQRRYGSRYRNHGSKRWCGRKCKRNTGYRWYQYAPWSTGRQCNIRCSQYLCSRCKRWRKSRSCRSGSTESTGRNRSRYRRCKRSSNRKINGKR